MKLTNEGYGFMIMQTPSSMTEIMSDVTSSIHFFFNLAISHCQFQCACV